MRDAPHHCLQETLRDLDRAFSSFYSGRSRYPALRRKFRNDSFRFPDPKQIKFRGCGRNFSLFLPKLGWVKGVLHRDPHSGSKLRSVTVSREADLWFASLLYEREIEEINAVNHYPDGMNPIGIDLGVVQPVTLSNGLVLQLPREAKGLAKRQKNLQRQISRRCKGSNNRRRAVKSLAKLKARQARRRRDTREKLTHAIAKNHGIVIVEALKLKNMTKSARGTIDAPGRNVQQKAGLNRSLLDISMGAFRTRLGQKLTDRGGEPITIDPAYTSRTCAECWNQSAVNRPTRDLFHCGGCGHANNADMNAARVILAIGMGWRELPKRYETIIAEGPSVAACGALSRAMALNQETFSRKVGKGAA